MFVLQDLIKIEWINDGCHQDSYTSAVYKNTTEK